MSCELYLITITFLSVDCKVQKSLPTEALSLFTPMRHFTHGGRPPDIPEILYQSGRFNNRVCTLRAALEAEKPETHASLMRMALSREVHSCDDVSSVSPSSATDGSVSPA